ncbi:MAG: YfbM family protein [Pseudomonadota bacterium]
MSMIIYLVAASDDELTKMANDNDADLLSEQRYASGRVADADKAWHAIHYCLTGDGMGGSFPAAFLLFGGNPFEADYGYGPARGIDAQTARTIKGVFDELSDSLIDDRLTKAATLADPLYPGFEWNDEDIEYIKHGLNSFKTFISQQVERGEGFVVIMS